MDVDADAGIRCRCGCRRGCRRGCRDAEPEHADADADADALLTTVDLNLRCRNWYYSSDDSHRDRGTPLLIVVNTGDGSFTEEEHSFIILDAVDPVGEVYEHLLLVEDYYFEDVATGYPCDGQRFQPEPRPEGDRCSGIRRHRVAGLWRWATTPPTSPPTTTSVRIANERRRSALPVSPPSDGLSPALRDGSGASATSASNSPTTSPWRKAPELVLYSADVERESEFSKL